MIGALALAVRDINADPAILRGKRLEYVWRDDGCNRLKSLAELSSMLGQFAPIDGLIGPGCAKGCEVTATLAQAMNIPQVSPTCAAPSLSNKDEFPLFVRTTSPYAKWAPAIVAFMRWAAWTRLSIVGDVAMAASAGPLRAEVYRSGLQLSSDMQFKENHFEAASLLSVRAAAARIVMVFAFGPDYQAIAVEALNLRMSQGWVWMGIDMVLGAEQGAKGAALARAQAALHGWVYFEPSSAARREFFDRVHAASIADFGQRLGNETPTSLYAANLYDAVMLYAIAAGKHLEELSDGKLIVEAMLNASFDGMTGRVELDGAKDLKESIRAMNYLLESDGRMHGRQIGVYDALSHRYSPLQNIEVIWPGGLYTVPSAEAVAVADKLQVDTKWIFVGAGSTSIVLVGGLYVLVRKRHAHLQAIMQQLFTEVSPVPPYPLDFCRPSRCRSLVVRPPALPPWSFMEAT